MPSVELNKTQTRALIDTYIEEMSTGEFEKFLLDNITFYSRWEFADLTRIIKRATQLQKKNGCEEEF